MVQPNVRMSFGRAEAEWLLSALREFDLQGARTHEEQLSDRGIDGLLDDPRVLRCILEGPPAGISLVPPRLAMYVLLRHALREADVQDRIMADYLTALLLDFGTANRAYLAPGAEGKEYRYLVDILAEIDRSPDSRAFQLRVHLGNYSLWLSGLFPDYIVARRHRRGGPGLDYYESIGRSAYASAARSPQIRNDVMEKVYRGAADAFVSIRQGLNLFSDRHLTPRAASPDDRLLRQISTRFRAAEG